MSSNTENIEAKLCAYVEGDLDEQGRVEIEKHLQSNPQHRLLLEELRQTKVMMQALPREAAPPELAETLHGQLERSVLLDGVGTVDYANNMKINRWPQLMAVAAVLVLASGLGVLVYVVLPKHADTTIAVRDLATPEASVRREPADKVDDKSDLAAREEFGKIAAKGEAAPGGGAFAEGPAGLELARGDSLKKEGLAGGGGGKMAAGAMSLGATGETGAGVRLAKGGEAMASAVAPQRVYIVLSTDNLNTTNGQVARYLESNKINYAPADPSVQQVFFSRANRTNVQLRVPGLNEGNLYNNYNFNTATTNSAVGVFGGNMMVAKDREFSGKVASGQAKSGLRDETEPRDPQQAAPAAAQSQVQQQYRQQYDSQIRARNGADQLASQTQSQTQTQAPTQAPAEQQPAEQVKQQEVQQVAGSLVVNQQGGQQAMPAFNLAESTSENVIVARGLTREQAAMICDSLGKLYAGQTAVVVDRDLLEDLPKVAHLQQGLADAVMPPVAPATQPATQPVAETDAESKAWAQIPAAGLDRKFGLPTEGAPATQPAAPAAPTLTPATQPSQELAFDGRLSQPVAEKPKAAEDLDLSVSPTTRPAEPPLEVVIVVQPAVQEVVPDAPAVQPAPAAVPVPPAEPADVAARPAPATQPATNLEQTVPGETTPQPAK